MTDDEGMSRPRERKNQLQDRRKVGGQIGLTNLSSANIRRRNDRYLDRFAVMSTHGSAHSSSRAQEPFGSWHSPITAELIAGAAIKISELKVCMCIFVYTCQEVVIAAVSTRI